MKKLLDLKGKQRASGHEGAGSTGPSNPPGGGGDPGGLGGGILQGGPPLPAPTPMFPHVLNTGMGGGPKIKTPNLYNGDTNELDKFKMECHLYIMAKPQQFTTEDMKITFVLSYIKGD